MGLLCHLGFCLTLRTVVVFRVGEGGVYIAITLSICLSLHTCKHRKEGGPGLEEHQGRLLKGDYSREIVICAVLVVSSVV